MSTMTIVVIVVAIIIVAVIVVLLSINQETKAAKNKRLGLASALEAEMARRDRARIDSPNAIKLYSFQTLNNLHLAYAFAKNRYHEQIGLYKSHVVSNYTFFLVFLAPKLDGWGKDKEIESVISALPGFLIPGDFETANRQALADQTDKLPFPSNEEMLLLTKELRRRA
jgi:type II secretory pathway pseudopilin PulG